MIEFIILSIAVLLTSFAISLALNWYFVKYGRKDREPDRFYWPQKAMKQSWAASQPTTLHGPEACFSASLNSASGAQEEWSWGAEFVGIQNLRQQST